MKKLVILTALFLSFSVSAEWNFERNGLFDDKWWRTATLADVKQEIAAGASVKAKDRNGDNPFHYAATYIDNPDIINVFIAAGADVNVKGLYDTTPLHRAMYNKTPNYLDVIKALIAAGADINIKDNKGRNALWYAASNNQDDGAKILIAAGADINIKDNEGRTAFDLVKSKYGPDHRMIKILRTPDNNQIINTLKNSQSGKKSSSDYVRTPSVNDCVSILARKNQASQRTARNICNFYIKVWHCEDGYKLGCNGNTIDHTGDRHHFPKLSEFKAGETNNMASYWKYKIRFFACKGRHSHITNNKRGETTFGCKTDKSLLDKYGFTE